MRIHAVYRLITAIVLLVIALYGAISLLLYNRHMPSMWLYTSDTCSYAWYANGAASLLYWAGGASWILVCMSIYGAWCCVRKRSLSSEWERILAWCVLLTSVSGYCALNHIDVAGSYVCGGYLGLITQAMCIMLFGSYIASVWLSLCIWISCMILARWRFMPIVHHIVVWAERLCVHAYEQRWVQRTCDFVCTVSRRIGKGVGDGVRALWNLINGRTVHDAGMDTPSDALTQYEALRQLSESLHALDALKKTEVQVPLFPLHEKRYASHDDVVAIKNEHASLDQEPVATNIHVQEDVITPAPEKKRGDQAYVLPGLDIFIASQDTRAYDDMVKELEIKARLLEEKLQRFGITGTVSAIKCGPIVTLYEYQPTIDTKISKIIALEDDLALALQAMSIRIIAPIPGRSVVGFEVANGKPQSVLLSKVLHSSAFTTFNGFLPLALGVDTVGESVVVDLSRMPHLLIAGSTGSGKSVALNAMLTSLLCRCTPDEMKLILIDPKRLEFAAYADIAHLLFPIVTDPRRAAPILRWVVKQMEQRYELMAEHGVRTVKDYNAQIQSGAIQGQRVPFIVVVIDELADLMMTSGRDVEDGIARIAQMARAAGIHLIVATQRPSVDVITGLIKVNFPSRISFRVTSRVDSRTILDAGGAEKLLGRGDLLFLDSTSAVLRRLHGAYVSDEEINTMVDHIRRESPPAYLDITQELMTHDEVVDNSDADLYKQVLVFLDDIDEVSISLLQREFRIGYNRSARIIDQLEKQGLLMPPEGSKPRKVVR